MAPDTCRMPAEIPAEGLHTVRHRLPPFPSQRHRIPPASSKNPRSPVPGLHFPANPDPDGSAPAADENTSPIPVVPHQSESCHTFHLCAPMPDPDPALPQRAEASPWPEKCRKKRT